MAANHLWGGGTGRTLEMIVRIGPRPLPPALLPQVRAGGCAAIVGLWTDEGGRVGKHHCLAFTRGCLELDDEEY